MGHLLRRAARGKRLSSAVRPVIETLETRQLLSVSLHHGVLAVVGTEGADQIVVRPSTKSSGKLQVTVNGTSKLYAQAAVKAVTVKALAGDDRVSIEQLSIPCTVWGGAGDDTLGGSNGADRLDGGLGNDLLTGGAGDDTLVGGHGDDRLIAGEGDDRILPGKGKNSISTGPESGKGKDRIKHWGGEDRVNEQVKPNFPIYSFTGTPTAYSPVQIRRAYGFGSLADSTYTNRGQGQAIAIVDAYHTVTARSDLAKFSSQYGLPQLSSKTFLQVYASGHQPTTDEGWAGEALLDIQWAHAIAPQATIILVEADTALNADISRAIDKAVEVLNKKFGGGVVSMSLGGVENGNQTMFDGSFSNAYTKNITFVASAGDTPVPSHPATHPGVVAVGGTKLFLDAYGNRVGGDTATTDTVTGDATAYVDSEAAVAIEGGERPWFLAGSGPSAVYPEPLYQQNRGVNYPAPNLTTGTIIGPPYNRGTPDITYNADPASGVAVYNSFGDAGAAGWFSVGGTSAGAPQIAALFALANQVRAETVTGYTIQKGKKVAKTLPKLGNTVHDRLYRLGQRGPDTYFNDITQLGVLPTTTPTTAAGPFLYPAATGWDYASGWGSPNARTLIPALAEQKMPFTDAHIQFSGTLTTYSPQAAVDANKMRTMQIRGNGAVLGVRTLGFTPHVTSVFGGGRTTTVSLFGFDAFGIPTAPDPVTGLGGNPIILSRAGDSLVGQGKFEIRTTPAAGTATVTRGFVRFEGKISSSGKLSGQYFSITPDGKPIKNAFYVDPANPNLPATYIKGNFSGS